MHSAKRSFAYGRDSGRELVRLPAPPPHANENGKVPSGTGEKGIVLPFTSNRWALRKARVKKGSRSLATLSEPQRLLIREEQLQVCVLPNSVRRLGRLGVCPAPRFGIHTAWAELFPRGKMVWRPPGDPHLGIIPTDLKVTAIV